MTGLLTLNALYSAMALTLACAFHALLTPTDRRDSALACIAALALAPPSVAWLSSLCLRLQPGIDEVTLGIELVISVLTIGALFAGRARRVRQRLAGTPGMDGALAVFLFGGAIFVLLASLARLTPIYENDALEYLAAGRIIAEAGTLDVYPMIDTRLTGGFYGPWTHPAGYSMLVALGHMYQDLQSVFPYARLPDLYAALALLLLIGIALPAPAGLIGMAVIGGTPLFAISCVNAWVDPPRVAAGVASTALLVLALRQRASPRSSSIAVVGIALGLTFFLHSIGLVVLALNCALLVILAPDPPLRRIWLCAALCLPAFVVVLPDLLSNLRNTGALVADAPPMWQIPGLGFREWMEMARDLSSWRGLVINGLLMGFTQQYYYGWSYCFALGGFSWWVWREPSARPLEMLSAPSRAFAQATRQDQWMMVAAAAAAFWFGCAILASLGGIYEFIKNVRYPYTIQPFIAMMAGIGFSRIWSTVAHPAAPDAKG